jgi:hypothetical protein
MSDPRTALPRRLRLVDLARLAAVGLRTRKLRAALSALGIAIGVAAIVAVLGLSSSSSAGLISEINRLGTNLLTVQAGQNLFTGQPAELPTTAAGMIGRVGPVTQVQATGATDADVYRSPLIPAVETNALSVDASSLGLLQTVGTTIAKGRFLDAATADEPVAVLGAAAAQRLGIDRIYPGERIWLSNMWFYVSGILKPDALLPSIDDTVLVGFPAAEAYLGFDGHPSTIYVKAVTSEVAAVQSVLAATANPEDPSEVDVSQPFGRPGGRSEGQVGLEQPLPRPWRHLVAGWSGRGGQHHADRSAGAALGDRTAPGPRCHQGPHPGPIPLGGRPVGRARRSDGGGSRRRVDGRLRLHQGLVRGGAGVGVGRRLRHRRLDRGGGGAASRVASCSDVADRSAVEDVRAASLTRWGASHRRVRRMSIPIVPVRRRGVRLPKEGP